jgi:hypothetical protein
MEKQRTMKREPTQKRPTRRQLLSMATAGAAAAAAVSLAGADAATVSAGSGPTLVGSWFAVYKRTPGDQLMGIWTYHADGTLVTTGSDHLTRTPSHGHWVSLGNNQFASTVVGINVDAAGNFAGTTEVDTDITLDATGNVQNNISRVSFYDASGDLTGSVSSAATARRMPLVRRTDPVPQAMNVQTS